MNIPVVEKILRKNEQAARQNRACFDSHGLTCVNILGGAGCGKTSLLEAVLPSLRDALRIGVLEGDVATTRDAERIAALQIPVVQILTGGGCHLTATLVDAGLQHLDLAALDLLVIENVGNPICPANFDLGEHLRLAVLSVTEGHDKPAKYPLLFKDTSLVVLTKCDLLPHTDFDVRAAEGDLRRLRPELEILSTSARTGSGIDALAAWLRAHIRRSA